MSHFTRIRTKIADKTILKLALTDLGYRYREGSVEVRGYGGIRTGADLAIATQTAGYEIGFQWTGASYDLVADWRGIGDIQQSRFMGDLTRRYAYHAARSKLEEQGFSLVEEQVEDGNRVHLVMRRAR